MDIEVFIGNLESPDFHYEGGNWSGNVPERIGKYFPNPHSIFFAILQKIEQGEVTGKQTDWGTWVAVLYPAELGEVIRELYGPNINQFSGILASIKQLDPNKPYGLVACEFG